MPTQWSDQIVLTELADEPQLSDELAASLDLVEGRMDRAEAGSHVVVSFAEVGYLNSSHLAQLVTLRKAVIASGCKLLLCGINDQIWTMMLATNLDKLFEFAPDTPMALAMLQIGDAEVADEPDHGKA